MLLACSRMCLLFLLMRLPTLRRQREATLATADPSRIYREIYKTQQQAEDRNNEERVRNVKTKRVEQLEAMLRNRKKLGPARYHILCLNAVNKPLRVILNAVLLYR